MQSLLHRLAAWLLASYLFLAANAQGLAPTTTNSTGPLSQFKSRPDIYAPFLNISLFVEDSVTPGYIFLGPYQTFQAANYIYDNTGNLVWSGFGQTGGGPSHNFHVCSINGTDNLCYITGAQNDGYVRGYAVVLDSTLTTQTSIHSQGGLANFDEHEFNVVNDGQSGMFTLYNPEPYDLSSYNISGQGWLMNCYFQHINLGTGELQFEWSALDHVGVNETFVLPDSTEVSGDGLNPTSPWDYFHINSVDLNSDGDYLVSARHTCAVYKVSGQDGHIIWTLGGSNSDFTFAAGLNFSFQHDARFLEENDTTTVISLFDNASNGYNQTARYSAGKILKLDLTNNTVSLIQEFVSPYQFISASQGNVQLLGSQWNTSNAFLGWGENAYISEYTSDGTMVQQGHFATSGTMNYRAFKHNFTTNPLDAPALYTYAHNTTAPTSYWMSWNGATKVAQWQIYSGQSQSGPFTLVGTVNKTGFETQFTAKSYYPWSIVESLDADGNPLKNGTRPIRTFVPGSQLAALCDSTQCPLATSVTTSTASTSTTATSTATSSNAAVNIRSRGGKVGEMALAAMAGVVPFM
ncbi:hypothetical protein LTR10_022773 [Elasticomyces elasticus]|uniref:ASST-domain-containing protein n=1 Tax=Exophiala sideris TaxID=1016849 RepID=A0ABR0JP41_9EURO|nr:hypothetical protein LTR10_022773 [Elasticomyces elasticus]KAK5038004.1 hypothetical protein LTS07_001471 [Exophiala sideris]KAK5043986.1 hypothetical protein LTR13_000341 [Exophiala sideris]KAK5067485.1 hypothetical protein LTR69_001473 [Exophiala sideris]